MTEQVQLPAGFWHCAQPVEERGSGTGRVLHFRSFARITDTARARCGGPACMSYSSNPTVLVRAHAGLLKLPVLLQRTHRRVPVSARTPAALPALTIHGSGRLWHSKLPFQPAFQFSIFGIGETATFTRALH